jgi:hypothetical protein
MLNFNSLRMLRLLAFFLLFQVGNSLKHSFTTNEDDRVIIGPLGFPVGFLDTGHYDMTVSDFALFAGDHDEDGHSDSSETMNEIDGVGFLLKKFDDESDFYHYMNLIQQNGTECAFQSYLDQGDDMFDDGDDRFQQDGEGEVFDATKDGIFLDMKPKSRRAPNKPHVSYDFSRGEAGYYFLIYQVCPPPKVIHFLC